MKNVKSVKKTLKRGEVAELYQVLTTTNFDAPIDNKFRYVASKNAKKTKEEIDEINAAFTPPEDAPKYQKERAETFLKYKVKNDVEYSELADDIKKELDTELGKLDEKYGDLINELKQLSTDKKEFMEETVDISLYLIQDDYLPTISSQQQNGINGWKIWSVLETIMEEEQEVEETQEEVVEAK